MVRMIVVKSPRYILSGLRINVLCLQCLFLLRTCFVFRGFVHAPHLPFSAGCVPQSFMIVHNAQREKVRVDNAPQLPPQHTHTHTLHNKINVLCFKTCRSQTKSKLLLPLARYSIFRSQPYFKGHSISFFPKSSSN